MKVAVTGASGLIGSALVSELENRGDQVLRIGRTARQEGDIVWDPMEGTLDPALIEAVDAVVNLAGETIEGRWTAKKKKKILESRVKGTQLLSQTFQRLDTPPKIFVSSSASGFYGDRGEEILTESSTAGNGFLADVCKAWEAAADTSSETRLAIARTGVVFDPSGGALQKLLIPIRLFFGGPLGGGKQWWPWITLADEVKALMHMIDTDIEGPVNLVSPQPLRNKELTKQIAKALKRPAFIPAPAFALRALLGEMADGLLLSSSRILPEALEKSGFQFSSPDLQSALESLELTKG
ncbi:MAG: TIGR01777 family oxidoreductase [Actinomycetota bacterium]|nr:TIGR01777 family oxidoreductase [Actinomycetota bacterium]MEE2646997.1 TIGR01777 family oxidoreductase [Actinomycetota bacterium]